MSGLNKEGRAPEFIDPILPSIGDTNSLINLNEKPAFRMESKNTNNGLEVAIIGANSSTKNKDIASGLLATKHFSGVTVIDARVVTPSLSELEKFDSVMVYNNLHTEIQQSSVITSQTMPNKAEGLSPCLFENPQLGYGSKKYHFKVVG